jgi:phenylpropionate dioxygenase-like ring-hydroxylating dioxygenase large terminal subunit
MAPVGWFQIGFLPEMLSGGAPIMPLQVGNRRLMAIMAGSEVEIYDGICPHRGASLAHGGRLEGNTVICPFHGYAVALIEGSGHRFSAFRHPVCTMGDLVFVHLGPSKPLDLWECMLGLAATHRIVPGFTMSANVPYSLVTENAFDGAHFAPVHHARAVPVEAHQTTDGRFVGETELTIPPSRWQRTASADGMLRVPLQMSAYGAGVVVSHVGGANPYAVITTATPQTNGVTTIRLSMAFPKDQGKSDRDIDQYMIEQSRRGLELDRTIWSTMDTSSPPQFVESDKAVVAFREYCCPFLNGETNERR